MIEVEIKAEVNPTEESEQVLIAMRNFADFSPDKVQKEEIGDNYFLYTVKVSGRTSLQSMFLGLRSQRTVESARKLLMRKKREESVSFMLHKQGLFVQKFHFCHNPEESPMGPVWINIKSDDITRLLEYLVPHTIKGQPQEVDYLPS